MSSAAAFPSRIAALQVLGLDKDATPEEIKTAYRKTALKCHPDRNGGTAEATEAFQHVSAAYAFLTEESTTEADMLTDLFTKLVAGTLTEEEVRARLGPNCKVTVTRTKNTPKPEIKVPAPHARAPIKVKCRFWTGTHGSCKRGASCKFSHPTKICSHFNSPSGCKYGDRCNNLHIC